MKKIIFNTLFFLLAISFFTLFSGTVMAVGDTTPPTVTITAPSPGSSVIAGSWVNITANANDNIGITMVQFYVNGASQCIDAVAPYACNWNVPTSIGASYVISAVAYDTSFNQDTDYSFVFTETGDTISPVVSINSPTNGSNISTGTTVAIIASASDNIAVDRVEFYVGSTLKCTETVAPYTCIWAVPNVTGSYSLVAKAFDSSGNYSQNSILINAVDTIAPTVVFGYPTNGGTIPRNTTITMTAISSDNVGVSRVEFYVGSLLKCTDTLAPYTCSWKVPSAKGVVYSLTAKSFDAAGNFSQQSISVTSK